MSEQPKTRKLQTAAAFATFALVFVSVGALMRFFPSESAFGPVARVFDSLSALILLVSFVCSLLATCLGMRRIGGTLALLALASVGQQFAAHQKISLQLAPQKTATVRILFLNALAENEENGGRMIETALSFDPDVIVFAERLSVADNLAPLRDHYLFLSPCSEQKCELLVASKVRPKRFWTLTLNPVWDDCYAVAELELHNGTSFFLAANHLSKPWLSGIAESEVQKLIAQYNWLSGPSVVVGDFNAAPWSRPMLQLLSKTEMRTLRAPKGTWPAGAGDYGVPLDHVLVKNGARVVRIEYFGKDLGSNHRGFVADVALP
ncbi:MAG: endonuclease/exonuclease/phosphatase family protein [Tateyamaria sp.]|uniref:endonuclease/exonuclease/phosphatase family protein n=2 Tax=Tateyamaria sp. TaxID=1929288 RepID=UPI00329E62B0